MTRQRRSKASAQLQATRAGHLLSITEAHDTDPLWRLPGVLERFALVEDTDGSDGIQGGGIGHVWISFFASVDDAVAGIGKGEPIEIIDLDTNAGFDVVHSYTAVPR